MEYAELLDDVELTLAEAACPPECMFYMGPNGGACYTCTARAIVDKYAPHLVPTRGRRRHPSFAHRVFMAVARVWRR